MMPDAGGLNPSNDSLMAVAFLSCNDHPRSSSAGSGFPWVSCIKDNKLLALVWSPSMFYSSLGMPWDASMVAKSAHVLFELIEVYTLLDCLADFGRLLTGRAVRKDFLKEKSLADSKVFWWACDCIASANDF